jgi:hypothetical protein
MKATIKVPIEEVKGPGISMWSYVELEMEEWGSPDEMAETYRTWKTAFAPIEGVDKKTYDTFIEQQLSGKGIENGMIESYEQMNEWQKFAVDVIRRGKARLKSK